MGKAASAVFGVGFVTLQTLSYKGYIQINHDAMKKEVERMMDFNNDGKVDWSDAEQAKKYLMGILNYNLPSGSGFGAGFAGGLRSG